MDDAKPLDRDSLLRYVAISYAALESILLYSEPLEPRASRSVLAGQLEEVHRTAFNALARIPSMPKDG